MRKECPAHDRAKCNIEVCNDKQYRNAVKTIKNQFHALLETRGFSQRKSPRYSDSVDHHHNDNSIIHEIAILVYI